ncbi:MAG: tetratricopeptide repeat protein, partial [Cyclobacteriaceae bacterium]|nr:tetratricopeptide repeat protein [Cyclobacteriaceae bacterium]
YQKTVSLPDGDHQVIEVNIGRDLLNYTTDIEENRISRPLTTPSGQDFNSAEHLFRVADDMNFMRDYGPALATYLECLEKEPTHSRALSKVAELYYRKGQYEKGLNYARRVLENNTYDGEANFIYGVIHKAMGNLTQAEEAFSIAVRTMEYRSAAYVQIAGLHLQKQNYKKARVYAEKALDYNRYNITAYEFLGIAYRKQNKLHEAEKNIETLLEIDPLNHYANFELYLLNPSTELLKTFASAIRNELPFETYLELALEYANQGFVEEAIKVLEQSPEYPTVNYWLAYLNRARYPDKSRQYLKRAVELSPRMAFPFRLETIPVLAWAQEQNSSWKTTYYLGLIYWRILRIEKAKELFTQCGDSPDYATFYMARGILFQKDGSKNQLVSNDFRKANKLEPEEWRTWHYLNNYLATTGLFQQELENSKKALALFPNSPALGIDYAKALMNNNKLSESIKILTSIDVLPFEGAREGYDIYEQAN